MIPSIEIRKNRPCYTVQMERDIEKDEVISPWKITFLCKHCLINLSEETAICDLNGKDTGWARDETCRNNITEDEYRELIDSGAVR